jgi:hypothetical protein
MSPRKSYLTTEQQALVLQDYPTHGAAQVAAQLGVPKHAVKNLVYRHRLKRDPASSQRRHFTPQEKELIMQHYANTPTKVLAERMNRTVFGVYRMATQLGLKKSAAFLASEASGRMAKGSRTGAATRFVKGQASHNKGVPLTPEVRAKVARTWFKKGNVPHNTKHDGHISVRRDTDGRQYFYIRLSIGKHKLLHRYLWEQAHGPVPSGYVITFKDGNQGNCVLDNLECITMAERMKRTSIMRYPPEIRNVMRLLAKLNREIQNHGQE